MVYNGGLIVEVKERNGETRKEGKKVGKSEGFRQDYILLV